MFLSLITCSISFMFPLEHLVVLSPFIWEVQILLLFFGDTAL